VVQALAGIRVPDTVSGFRAMSREAALQLNVVTSFSYTTEMIIQAGKRGIAVTSVPMQTNPQTRSSRLFRGMLDFIARSAVTMLRTYAMYKPLRVFFFIGSVLSVLGLWPMLRFLYHFFSGGGEGHIQSLVIGAALLIMGFVSFMIGLLADLIAVNRNLLESTLQRLRKLELEVGKDEE
jgi:hypothetical protein